MAVTITEGELATALRITVGPTLPIPQPYLVQLRAALQAATVQVELNAPDAPTATQNQAVVAMSAALIDQPSFVRTPALAFRNSGAAALLSSWRVLLAEVVR